ncbi:MAG: DEAD/DEAH box helicase [Bacteroidaceae bacterium]|nr:DEAD/DEAH box helicase [Bacteroidaceae bacterium]
MLNLDINSAGLVFTVNLNGVDIPVNEWSNTDDCIYYLPLQAMADNGFADFSESKCTIPFEYIYQLDTDDMALLGVPEPYDKALRLRSNGMLNSVDFRYKLDFLSYVPDGDILQCERIENIVSCNNNKFLLSVNQYLLIREIDKFNSTQESEKSTDYNLRCFARIKKLAYEANCELDSYLENENVHVPEKIKIEVGQDDLGYTIDPSVGITDSEKFKSVFDKMRKVQGVYPVAKENGERVRVVITPEQKESLDYIKRTGGRRKSLQEIRDIIQNPTEFFDPEQFDLSELYSDRVIDIGVYKPKFYPFISPYKSCWVFGAAIESPQSGTTKIYISSKEELDKLEEAIKEASQSNSPTVKYEYTEIAVEDAKFLAQKALEQLKQPQSPIDVESIPNERKVLIIKDNAEELAFKSDFHNLENTDKYTLYKNPFLQTCFSLKNHQEEGVAWLQYLYNNKASGCLMADDMGLGKTLQILYFIDWHSRQFPNHKPYLIVAPISLLENWENEYERFFMAPRLSICRLSSRDIPRQFNKAVVDMMQKMDIILTNYESLRTSQLNFCAVEFDIVALDEAQKIKSPGTLVTNAAKALKSNFKIAMTGTPVENTLLDLWCIMDFCVPGLLGNAKSFAAKYQNPLKNEDTDIVALGNEIHQKLGVYLMRRLKKDAAKDLPKKEELKRPVYMPALQEATYIKEVNNYVSGEQPNMLLTINRIKEISEHPFLYDMTLQSREPSELVGTSARLQATILFLDNIHSLNEKVILFAERKESQKMLQRICLERYGIIPKIINGDTPTISTGRRTNKQSRQTAIDDFQSTPGFNIIIMSPIAAGMGLNVTAANHVIHFSRHWNPAKENQATDRAYRIGQTKDVFVYYPMATSPKFKSFDETLDELLSRKTTLATSTIFPTERIEVSPDDFGQLFV